MHEQVRKLLSSASGEPASVLALNLDIREFSKFSLDLESMETAFYVRKAYEAILNDFFPDVSFFKLTGDGLLLVFQLVEGDTEKLAEVTNTAVQQSCRLVESFPTLLEDDEWIYFPMPKKIGIGLARGTACRLVADDLTLDYSGTVLNVATRLMDIARPEGVVLDQTVPFKLLEEDLRGRFFSDENVYLRSVAETIPRRVYYRRDWTTISPANRRAIEQIDWKEKVRKYKFKDFRSLGGLPFGIDLDAEPLDPGRITARITYPKKAPRKGVKPPASWRISLNSKQRTYENDGGQPRLSLRFSEAIAEMESDGVKDQWPVTLRIKYPT